MTTLLSVRVQGIRSFGADTADAQQIHFECPLTIILGPNGSGKTVCAREGHVCLYLYACMNVCVCVCMYAMMYVCVVIYEWICACVFSCVCFSVHVFVCLYRYKGGHIWPFVGVVSVSGGQGMCEQVVE